MSPHIDNPETYWRTRCEAAEATIEQLLLDHDCIAATERALQAEKALADVHEEAKQVHYFADAMRALTAERDTAVAKLAAAGAHSDRWLSPAAVNKVTAERDAAIARAERAEADVHEAYGRLRHTTAIEVECDAAVARAERAAEDFRSRIHQEQLITAAAQARVARLEEALEKSQGHIRNCPEWNGGVPLHCEVCDHARAVLEEGK
jgi:hypothetical protein